MTSRLRPPRPSAGDDDRHSGPYQAVASEFPRLRTMARHSLPRLIESTIIPLGLFYGFLHLAGVWVALIACLGWSYAAVLRRLLRGDRVPGVLILATGGITMRTAIAAASGSVFLYFLQPSVWGATVACAFLLSVPAGRPLAELVAADFCPLPPALLARPEMKQVFVRITLLWGFVNLTNAAVTIWLLETTPMVTYVAAKTLVSWVGTLFGFSLSVLWLRRVVGSGVSPASPLRV
jgi:hypothetical protein